VGLGQAQRALAVMGKIFAEQAMPERSQAIVLLGSLARQIRLVWLAREAGASTGERSGLPPFIVTKLRQQAAQLDERRLRRAHAGLARLDLDLKGGSTVAAESPRLALERWVLDLCDGLPGTDPRQ
jgi:DNA polymerase III delta subunit